MLNEQLDLTGLFSMAKTIRGLQGKKDITKLVELLEGSKYDLESMDTQLRQMRVHLQKIKKVFLASLMPSLSSLYGDGDKDILKAIEQVDLLHRTMGRFEERLAKVSKDSKTGASRSKIV